MLYQYDKIISNTFNEPYINNLIKTEDIPHIIAHWDQASPQEQAYIGQGVYSIEQEDNALALMKYLEGRYDQASQVEKTNIGILFSTIGARVPNILPQTASFILDKFDHETDLSTQRSLMSAIAEKSLRISLKINSSEAKINNEEECRQSLIDLTNKRCQIIAEKGNQELQLIALKNIHLVFKNNALKKEIEETLHKSIIENDRTSPVHRESLLQLAYCGNREDEIVTDHILENYKDFNTNTTPANEKNRLLGMLIRIANKRTYPLIEKMLTDSDPNIRANAAYAKDQFEDYLAFREKYTS